VFEFVVCPLAATDSLQLVSDAEKSTRFQDEVRDTGELLDLAPNHDLPFTQRHS